MGEASNNLILIDGHSLIHRAFYALPTLTTSSGEHTNAVYGFALMLQRLIQDEKPGYIAVAFDVGKKTFRHDLDPSYKGERPSMPDELRTQVALVKNLVDAYGIAAFEMENYEADDVIGTLARQAEANDMNVLIVTGDMDVLQLVTDRVTALITRRGIKDMERFDVQQVHHKLGVFPGQVADLKALAGDPSDNIPGVPRIGPKTAARLLGEYGSVESVVNHAPDVKGKVGEELRLHRERAILGKQLAQIDCEVPLEIDWNDLRWSGPDLSRLVPLYRRLEFRRLLEEVTGDGGEGDHVSPGVNGSPAPQVEIVTDPHHVVSAWNADKDKDTSIALYPVYDGSPPHDMHLIGIAWATEEQVVYIPWSRKKGDNGDSKDRELILETIFSSAGKGRMSVSHEVKALIHLLASHGVETDVIDDVVLMGYLLTAGQGSFSMDDWLDVPPLPSPSGEDGLDEMASVVAARCSGVRLLHTRFQRELEEKQLDKVYRDLELPLVPVLAAMERRGVRVDRPALRRMSQEMEERLHIVEEDIYTLAGERFNINSPKQVAHCLFDRLSLPVIAKTKSGPSTSADVLEQLTDRHEIVGKILDYRHIQKLKSTYIDALPDLLHEQTDRLHTTFNQTVAATGRLSSNRPNLQNIPVRTKEGQRIRQVFVPSDGYTLVKCDYSQIELRVLAHMSQDEELVEAFRSGVDVHRKTAAEILHIDPSEVTPAQRESAKAINFGIVYGISGFGLAQGTGLSQKEAQTYIDSYLRRYRGVARYMEDIVEQARLDGYVTTLSGRRRELPDIQSRRWHARKFAERTAINTPIQGSAADIIKAAMIAVHKRIIAEDLPAHMLLQVHDELLFEVATEHVRSLAQIAKEEMETAFSLSVPLVVDVSAGMNWLDQHPVDL